MEDYSSPFPLASLGLIKNNILSIITILRRNAARFTTHYIHNQEFMLDGWFLVEKRNLANTTSNAAMQVGWTSAMVVCTKDKQPACPPGRPALYHGRVVLTKMPGFPVLYDINWKKSEIFQRLEA